MIGLLIGLVVFCVVAYILYLIVTFIAGLVGLPTPIMRIIFAVFGLILLLVFLDAVGLYHAGWAPRWR